jgi:hypothetical protein
MASITSDAYATGAIVNSQPTSSSRSKDTLAGLVAIAIILLAINVVLGSIVVGRNPGLSDVFSQPPTVLFEGTSHFLIDSVNEEPNLASVAPDAHPPICDSVDIQFVPGLSEAFVLMRGTDEGSRLYDELVARDVCVSVDQLTFNGGYSTSWRDWNGDWQRGAIVIDDDYVTTWEADVLAAMLIHEATHIDRAIHGTSCEVTLDCETLSNGVDLEEEMAAHAAEAQWWDAAYGDDGKSLTIGHDYGENALLDAYLDGPEAFEQFVRDLRSDPREGQGL